MSAQSTMSWVVGSGGLLGSALCRELAAQDAERFVPSLRFSWTDALKLPGEMAIAVARFAERVASCTDWRVYWAAGVGAMGSRPEDLASETNGLRAFLELLRTSAELAAKPGKFAFASSAGAIYAGCREEIIDENTPPAPSTPYAQEKLRQEDLLRRFSADAGVTTYLCRLSTLYGIGQSADKKQGLITTIARNVVRNQPVQIFVPLDTIRDYIHVDDAAAEVVQVVEHTPHDSTTHLKIVASGQPTTIAEIVATFKRITKRNPRVLSSANKLSALYARRVQFRSVVFPELDSLPPRSLQVGIAKLLEAERAAFAKSRFDSPRLAS